MMSADQRYLSQVRRALCCPPAEKKRLLAGLQQELADALADTPGLSWAQLCERFGTPQAAAQELRRALPAGMAEAAARRRGRRLAACLLALLAAVILAAGWALRAERQRAEAAPPEVIVVQPTPEVVYLTPPPTPPRPVELPEAPAGQEEP